MDSQSQAHLRPVPFLSHALYHDPDAHFLDLDSEVWTEIDDVVLAIRYRGSQWHSFSHEDLQFIAAHTYPQRFEIKGDRIRALYGHSVPFVGTGIDRKRTGTLARFTDAQAC